MPDWSVSFEVAFDTDPAVEPGGAAWTNLSSRLHAGEPIDISLGSGRLSGGSEGSVNLLLDNDDRAIDPTNAAATYNLVPLRHARLRATIGATTYPLFRGYVDAWPPSGWSNFTSTVKVRLVDLFAWLGLQDADLDLPRQMSHERVNAILDLAGVPASLRDIANGVVELEPHEQASANLLQSLKDASDAEGGDLYIAPDGKVTFRSRHNRFGATPDVTFGEGGIAFSDSAPAWDTSWLTNTSRVELDDGRVYEVIDDTSVDAYGPRVMPTRDLALRAAEALVVAQWEIYRFAEPRLWVDGLLVESCETDALPSVLGLRVGHLAAVAHTAPAGDPVDTQLNIERVRHRIGAVDWQATFDLSPYFGAGPWFTWDEPALGWDLDAAWAP